MKKIKLRFYLIKKQSIKSFKNLNWKLLLIIFLSFLIPNFYTIIRIYFISSINESNSYNIASNLQWINVIFQILDDALILPLFFILYSIANKKFKNLLLGRFYLFYLFYGVFLLCLIIFTPSILKSLNPYNTSSLAIKYIRIEFASKFFTIIIQVAVAILIANDLHKKYLFIIFLQLVINILIDLFLISNLSFSIKMNVIGSAINILITNFIIAIVSILFIVIYLRIKLHDLFNPIFNFSKKEIIQFSTSGLESLIRNLFFLIFIVKTINNLSSKNLQAIWWTLDNFAWNLLFIGVFALSKYSNKISPSYKKNTSFWERFGSLFILNTLFILIWLLTIPLYPIFLHRVWNIKKYQLLFKLILISLPFYIFYSYTQIIDKFFYGHGVNQIILIQTIITNLLVYLPFYFLRKYINIEGVAITFGIGMLIDGLFTILALSIYLKKYK